jgi:PTH2 family peptidyl-tRNA hydrolase
MIKQVIVIRKDLNMRKGKMVAQGAHASMAAITNQGGIKHPSSDKLIINMTKEMKSWLLGSFTKICVGVNSEKVLLDIFNKANRLEIPCSLITDNGTTEFDGVPTNTAVAIGPAKSEIIDLLTGDLKLL